MDISLHILLFLALLILLANALRGLTQRLGFPGVLGELLAGVILGPTVFNVWRLTNSHPTLSERYQSTRLTASVRGARNDLARRRMALV